MNLKAANAGPKAVDGVQQRLVDYACALRYDELSQEAIQTAKARLIDTLGALIGGFSGDVCRVARKFAAQFHMPGPATIIGTPTRTTPEMAAFVNATTARAAELLDVYHWPGSTECHPSDAITPILAIAEQEQASGRELIESIVLGYEIFLRLADAFHNEGFDPTNFACLATAVASGKLMRLTPQQLSHCIAMAVVPNIMLKQARVGPLSMYKATASGQAGRAGIFAALLARQGMEGPHLPFEGKAGWCDHVARERFSLGSMGGKEVPFKILDTRIKHRASCGGTISSILAAEKIAPGLTGINDIERVGVEIYQLAKENVATGEHRWNPDTREAADHSIPYVVAATLMDGTITLRSFNDANLWNPQLRALMAKVEVTEDPQFTEAYARHPPEHRTRITVFTRSGQPLSAESGGDADDLAAPKSDAQIEEKFLGLVEEGLGAKRAQRIISLLWNLDAVEDVSHIPQELTIV